MKIKIVEMQPPPNFQAAAPARSPRNGPSIVFLLTYCSKTRSSGGAMPALTIAAALFDLRNGKIARIG